MATESSRDQLLRFVLARSGVRGVLVSLDEAWQQVREREDYPDALADLLGETCAAACLFTGHVKVEGRLSIQLKGDGALRTLFAECTRGGRVRGIALWHNPLPARLGPRDLGERALLAITIEKPSPQGEPVRYQGLVGLDSDTLARAFEGYFEQSEQLPTCLLLQRPSLTPQWTWVVRSSSSSRRGSSRRRRGRRRGTAGPDSSSSSSSSSRVGQEGSSGMLMSPCPPLVV